MLIDRGGVQAATAPLDAATIQDALDLAIAQRAATAEADKLNSYPVEPAGDRPRLRTFETRFPSAQPSRRSSEPTTRTGPRWPRCSPARCGPRSSSRGGSACGRRCPRARCGRPGRRTRAGGAGRTPGGRCATGCSGSAHTCSPGRRSHSCGLHPGADHRQAGGPGAGGSGLGEAAGEEAPGQPGTGLPAPADDRGGPAAVMEIEQVAFRTPGAGTCSARELGHDWSTILVVEEPRPGG